MERATNADQQMSESTEKTSSQLTGGESQNQKQMCKTIMVAGAGGFIGGHLVKYFEKQGHRVLGVDKKPRSEWYQLGEQNWRLDLSEQHNCELSTAGIDEVYNLAADMGGMGFIELHRIECMRSVLINTHLIEAAQRAGAKKYFFASSACVYNASLQNDPNVRALKESDAYPAMAERGYGWEKLYSEMLCQEYTAERGLPTFIARFHNVYGPYGTWKGGREKAPAALCRKVIEAIDKGADKISIWGDGTQTRSFQFIDDCTVGIDLIVNEPKLNAVPVNLGSSELVSINELADRICAIAGVSLGREYDLSAPKGVAGRNSDNTFIQSVLRWEPSISLNAGLKRTYHWIDQQYHNE